MSDLIGVWVGAVLTLLVFSYLLGDTFLFRIAQAIFVGVAAGYAATVAIYAVLWRQMLVPILDDPAGNWRLYIPLVLGVLLLMKLRASTSPLGNIPIAYLFGVGAALAIGGTLAGALVPQISATVVSISPDQNTDTFISNVLIVIGTLGAFLSFRFIVPGKESRWHVFDMITRAWGRLGRWFIFVAFGAIFAGTAASRVAVLIDRIYFILRDALQVVK